jgi:hypothetical protein
MLNNNTTAAILYDFLNEITLGKFLKAL